MRTLNVGILAHVDAGKTTLTERLLHAAGVIDAVGSVDDGSTQTDTLALERRRGITIRSAVVSFPVDDVTVNLVDTPGHPDFIAEVERVLGVLDGAVLVVSAVEGVQPQTRVLMRTLQRLRIPTLLFVNKIDRVGARHDRVLAGIARKLTPAVVSLGTTRDLGTRVATFAPYGSADARFADRLAEVLAEHDDAVLAAYVDGVTLPYEQLRRELTEQTGRALVHPVFFGSAATGAGVGALTAGIRELLPATDGDADGPVSGTVFKVERGAAGEKVAYVRMFTGAVRVRDRLLLGDGDGQRVTAVSVFGGGRAAPSTRAVAGQVAKLWGLSNVRVGDPIGAGPAGPGRQFAPPTLETVVVPRRADERGRLRVALAQLAEQDPLIGLRQDDVRRELYVSLYGEVQKDVVQATLADEFGVEVDFRETAPVCIERVIGTGAAVEMIEVPPNPFLATVGLRVDPAPAGGGVSYRREVELGALPAAFHKAIEETVHETLGQGLYGWQVTDCAIALTHTGYWPRQSHMHATFDKSMSSTAGDFRNLVPLVLMAALRRAGTAVCEPIHRFRLELPGDSLGAVLPALHRLGAVPRATAMHGEAYLLDGTVPAGRVHELHQQLPGLTRGEGVVECEFDHYRPARGTAPNRPRADHNPLDRKEYLLHVQRRQ